MKIDEALDIINGTETTFAEVRGSDLYVFERERRIDDDWFLQLPTKANNWDSISFNEYCLTDVYPQDLARVMDVIQRLLDTPVKERLLERKYTIQVIANNDDSYLVKIHGSNKYFISALIMKDAYGDKVLFTKSEIEMLKQRDDIAIDWDKAKIEEVKDNETD